MYYLLFGPRRPSQAELDEVDFDSFLVTKGEAPTGLAEQPSKKKKRQSRNDEWGTFDTFLKDKDEDERDPAVFSTFLKNGATAKPVVTAQQISALLPRERPMPSMARVLVLYGTEYGFSREIAEMASCKLKETKQFWPTVVDMATRPEGLDFSREQAVIVACSTQARKGGGVWDEGVP